MAARQGVVKFSFQMKVANPGMSSVRFRSGVIERDVLYFVHVGRRINQKAVYFSNSKDRGRNWSPLIAIDDVGGSARDPKITSRSEDLYVVWEEDSEKRKSGGVRQTGIYFSHSLDGGKSWSGSNRIRRGEGPEITIGADGILYLTSVGGDLGNIIYLSFSRDSGNSWKTVTPGELMLVVKEPFSFSEGNSYYIVFQGLEPNVFEAIEGLSGKKLSFNTYYLQSSDAGKNWSEVRNINKE
jgi:hypothetical protein